MDRRLPLYFLIDVSERMTSDAMKAINKALADCFDAFKKNPLVLESLWISYITIGKHPRQLMPLTEWDKVEPEFLLAERGTGGASDLGSALRLVTECCEREIVGRTSETRGDWNPVVIVLTGTKPTGDLSADVEIFNRRKYGSVVVVRFDKNVDRAIYEQFSSDVYDVDDLCFDSLNEYILAGREEMMDADPEIPETVDDEADLPSQSESSAFKVPSAMFIRCPKCKESLELPREAVGRKVQCPFCQNVFTGRAAVLLVDFDVEQETKGGVTR